MTVVNMRSLPMDLRVRLNSEYEADGHVLIDRRTKWGNRFRMRDESEREATIEEYRKSLWRRICSRQVKIEDLAALADKTLVCWCAPSACHGDVLARAATWAKQEIEKKGTA